MEPCSIANEFCSENITFILFSKMFFKQFILDLLLFQEEFVQNLPMYQIVSTVFTLWTLLPFKMFFAIYANRLNKFVHFHKWFSYFQTLFCRANIICTQKWNIFNGILITWFDIYIYAFELKLNNLIITFHQVAFMSKSVKLQSKDLYFDIYLLRRQLLFASDHMFKPVE